MTTKRARTEQATAGQPGLQGREQLLLKSPELQTRLGKKYCDETELLPLLLSQGLVLRIRTIQVEVRPLGGDSFHVTLDASQPSVGEAKEEIARVQGTAEARQELYRVAMRADGAAVREDDAEPEVLDDVSQELTDSDVVAMAVKEVPLVWQHFDERAFELSHDGEVVTDMESTHTDPCLVTSGTELSEGTHYWEVELLSNKWNVEIGVSVLNLDHNDVLFIDAECTEAWLIGSDGLLLGNGKGYNHDTDRDDDQGDGPGPFEEGDRVGILLDLDLGSLCFFKNGKQHGPGYPAGSVIGPVVHAVISSGSDASLRLLSNALCPRLT
jgi:hypothetical protein